MDYSFRDGEPSISIKSIQSDLSKRASKDKRKSFKKKLADIEHVTDNKAVSPFIQKTDTDVISEKEQEQLLTDYARNSQDLSARKPSVETTNALTTMNPKYDPQNQQIQLPYLVRGEVISTAEQKEKPDADQAR